MEYLVNKTKSWQYIACRSVKPGFGIPMDDIRACRLRRIDFDIWDIVEGAPSTNMKFRAKLRR